MATSEFPSNSKKENLKLPEEKEVKKVVQGEVVRRKKPLGRRFMGTFFGGGDAKTVWGHVFEDVLVPAAKDMFLDVFNTGMERMVLGDSRRTGRRLGGGRPGEASYVSYNRIPGMTGARRESHEVHRQQISRRGRASHNFDEIVLPTRAEAEEVIDRLFDLISKYESASVADLYDLLGVEQAFTDEKWGWHELPGARALRVRGGYLLDLPKPEALD